ncbi:esterase, partial [Achromobacter xylosoxidans]
MSSAALAVSMIGVAPGMAAAQSRQGAVTPEAHVDERISLQKGEFLAGTWAAESGVTLDLLDSAGQHVRRLSDGEKPAGALMLVAPEDGLYTVRAQGQGLFRWAVTERLPLAEQRAPAAALDSPRLTALA